MTEHSQPVIRTAEKKPFHSEYSTLLAVQRENARLRAALEHYRHCRHGCEHCNCTKEARQAL